MCVRTGKQQHVLLRFQSFSWDRHLSLLLFFLFFHRLASALSWSRSTEGQSARGHISRLPAGSRAMLVGSLSVCPLLSAALYDLYLHVFGGLQMRSLEMFPHVLFSRLQCLGCLQTVPEARPLSRRTAWQPCFLSPQERNALLRWSINNPVPPHLTNQF